VPMSKPQHCIDVDTSTLFQLSNPITNPTLFAHWPFTKPN
jgi:hypothetical protein